MSEGLFDIISLIVEIIFEVAENSSSSNKGKERSTDFLSVKKQKRYKSIYKEPQSSTLSGYSNLFKTDTMNNEKDNLPESYRNPFVTNSINDDVMKYETPVKETQDTSKTIINEKRYEVDDHSICNTQANQVKLEILLLSYMFKEDDGKISGSEKRAIKKHFSQFKGVLDVQDIKEIKKFDRLDKSLINIRAFISQNHVTEGDISDAIRTLKDIERGSNRYGSVISRIESSLLEAMGY